MRGGGRGGWHGGEEVAGNTWARVPECIAKKVQTNQEVTKNCRLSWLTNSARVYEPRRGGGGSCGGS